MAIFVSASSLTDYVSCSQKVYYRIFKSDDGIEEVPTREMIMGTVTHKVLEKAWKSMDVALNLAEVLCKKEGLDEVGKSSVMHFIHTYFERFSSLVAKDDAIERRFKVKLYDDVYLVGVFDRITNGMVIDWKTNANPPKKIDNNIQFILYDLAYNLLYDKKANGLYLAALKDGSLVRYNESKQHVDAVTNYLIPDFVDAVRSKTFIKTGLFNGACYRCQYKSACLDGEKNELDNPVAIEE